MSILIKSLFVAFLVSLVGCGISFSTGDKSQTRSESETVATAETSISEELEDGVELIWEIPATPVTKYNIYLGNTPQSLQLYRTVSVAELERFRHDSFGPVFRYTATGLDKKCDIYISLEAENAAGKSPKTEAKKLSCE